MQDPSETMQGGGLALVGSGSAGVGETGAHRGLCLVGVLLFGIGAIELQRGVPCAVFRALSWPLGGIGIVGFVLGLVLLGMLPTRRIRAIPKMVLWILVGIWLLFCASPFLFITEVLRDRWDNDSTQALMTAAFGALLAWSNDSRWRIPRWSWRCVMVIKNWVWARPKATLITCFVALCLVNPTNAHETCMEASALSEKLGAYRLAIGFTRLARDEFPSQTWCCNCAESIREELTLRITRLELKRLGPAAYFNSPLYHQSLGHDNGPRDCSWVPAEETQP